MTSLPFGKEYDDLKSCFERTKNDPDFTEADKRQIYIAIKNKIEAEGWQKGDPNARMNNGDSAIEDSGTGDNALEKDKDSEESEDGGSKEMSIGDVSPESTEVDNTEEIKKLEEEEKREEEAVTAAMGAYVERRKKREADIADLRINISENEEKIRLLEDEEKEEKKKAKAVCAMWKARQKERAAKIEALKNNGTTETTKTEGQDADTDSAKNTSVDDGTIVAEGEPGGVSVDGEPDNQITVDGTVEDDTTINGEPDNKAIAGEKKEKKEEAPGFNDFVDNLEQFVDINDKTEFDDVKKRAEELYRPEGMVWNEEKWGRFIDRVERKFNTIKDEKEKNEFTPRRKAVINGLEEYLKNKRNEQRQSAGNEGVDSTEAVPTEEIVISDEELSKYSDSYTFARTVPLDVENLDAYMRVLKNKFSGDSMAGGEKTLRDRFIIKYGEDFDDYNERMLKVDEDDRHGVKFETIEEYEARRERVDAEKKAKQKTLGGLIKKFKDEATEMGSVIKVIDQLNVEDLKDVSMDTIRKSLEYYYYMSKGGKIKVYQGKEARDKSGLVGFSDEMRRRIQAYALERYRQLGLDYTGNKKDEAPAKRKLRDRASHWIIGIELRRLGA